MELTRRKIRLILFFLIPVISLAMHWRVFSLDLMGVHVWRQTHTQTNIVNFAQEDFNILNPRINNRQDTDGILRMEFPLMQWSFAGAHKILGDDIIITRLLSFLIGLFSIFGMYRLVRTLFDNRAAGLISAWCITFSPVFYYYTVNPLPDNLALACAIWALALFFSWMKSGKVLMMIASAVMFSLAALVKLPFVVLAAPVGLYVLRGIFRRKGEPYKTALIFLVFLSIPAAWYYKVIPTWTGNGVVAGVAGGTSLSEVVNVIVHHLISAMPESLVNYGAMLFFVTGLYLFFSRKLYRHELAPYLIAASAGVVFYFLFELNMISTVHDYYLFPFLPLIFIIVAYGASVWMNASKKYIRVTGIVLLLILPLTAWLRMDHRWNPDSPGFTKDFMVHREELRKPVPPSALCVVTDNTPHAHFYYLNRKGWDFRADSLKAHQLENAIARGAQYLYSDSRRLEEDTTIRVLLGEMILQKGEVRLFRLSRKDHANE